MYWGKLRNAHEIVVGELEGKRSIMRFKSRWKDRRTY
jgi:hypothetical protein